MFSNEYYFLYINFECLRFLFHKSYSTAQIIDLVLSRNLASLYIHSKFFEIFPFSGIPGPNGQFLILDSAKIKIINTILQQIKICS